VESYVRSSGQVLVLSSSWLVATALRGKKLWCVAASVDGAAVMKRCFLEAPWESRVGSQRLVNVLRASYWTVYRDLEVPRLLDKIREWRR